MIKGEGRCEWVGEWGRGTLVWEGRGGGSLSRWNSGRKVGNSQGVLEKRAAIEWSGGECTDGGCGEGGVEKSS